MKPASSNNAILGIPIENHSKKEILEKIIKNIKKKASFFHIVSLNPEILVISQSDKEFKQVLLDAALRIRDGSGLALAGKILNVPVGERVTGTELMTDLLKVAQVYSLRTLLIGGKKDLADRLAVRYQKEFPSARFRGVQGISDVKKALVGNALQEEKELFSIVSSYMPQIVLVSFGSPWQELWIDRNKKYFKRTICMGVGGAFDFYGGNVSRAPVFIRKIGFEWLYRLLLQPWRWKRQVRLLEFILSCFKQKYA